MINNIKKVVIVGGGTAGLISALSYREKFPFTKIVVIKSSAYGIIGVGEGSTEHWEQFIKFVGINRTELIRETKATVKIGILFKDWLRKNHEYVHSISDVELFSSLNRLDLYHYYMIKRKEEPFPLSPFFNFFRNNQVLVQNELAVSNQYHFDTFALNEYLTKKCKHKNIEFIDNEVEEVKLDVNGNVSKLMFKDNTEIAGDFFIDCSGFRRIISNALKNKWISYEQFLPMNRAIAFPTEHKCNQNYEPYTTSTALSSGWAWKIPTQERYGNGYVFNNNYISADNALHEISTTLGIDIEKVSRDIPFTAGRLDKFWIKNCVSIGLSGSFAEPLEAQSIGFSILQAFGVIDIIESWLYNNDVASKKYNELFVESFDNIVSYIQAHYFVERHDSKFWVDKPFELTDFNKNTKEIFSKAVIPTVYFQNRYLMFYAANFYQIYCGLKLIQIEDVEQIFSTNRESFNNFIKNVAENSSIPKCLMLLNHNDYINLIKNLK